MIAVRRIRLGVLGVLSASMVGLLAGGAPARAASPWWHLSARAQPTYLQSGQARDEVRKLTISATAGQYVVGWEENGIPLGAAVLEWDETHEQVQEALEGVYGPGNVRVTGGPGDAGGTNPYEITFVGSLSDQPVAMTAISNFLGIFKLEGGREEAAVQELVKGSADGDIFVTAVNLGDANVDPGARRVTIADRLPAGLKAVKIEGRANEAFAAARNEGPLECTLESLSCDYTGSALLKDVPPYGQLRMRIFVVVQPGAKPSETDEASISGGMAPDATVRQPIVIGETPTPFGVSGYEMKPEEDGGSVDTQAGSHPFQLTTTIRLNETLNTEGEGKPVAMVKDLHFKLPAGLIGNPSAVAKCTVEDFLLNIGAGFSGTEGQGFCPAQSVVGVARVEVNLESVFGGQHPLTPFVAPLFNLEPSVGEPARFGFEVPGTPVFLDTAVRTGSDYGVTVNVSNITETAEFVGSEVTFWGVPGDTRHNNARNFKCLQQLEDTATEDPTCASFKEIHPPPLLALPTSCTGPLQTSVEADSWKQKGLFQTSPATEALPALVVLC